MMFLTMQLECGLCKERFGQHEANHAYCPDPHGGFTDSVFQKSLSKSGSTIYLFEDDELRLAIPDKALAMIENLEI